MTLAVAVEDEGAHALRFKFTVTDTGIGIPEELRADLFEAFTQVDNSSTRSHGGSCLGLTISARLVTLMGGHLEMQSAEGSGNRFRFSLRFARGSGETQEVAMPAGGLEACRHIRALPNGALPIVALTANALTGERERCLAAGKDGYLTKPLEPETLYAELCRWLRVPAEVEAGQPTAAAAVSGPQAPPGFDAAKVQRWRDDYPDVWRGMVRSFVADCPAEVAAIGAALEAGDRARAGNLLHRAREPGSCGGRIGVAARLFHVMACQRKPFELASCSTNCANAAGRH